MKIGFQAAHHGDPSERTTVRPPGLPSADDRGDQGLV